MNRGAVALPSGHRVRSRSRRQGQRRDEVAYDTVVEHARSVIKGVADAVWAEDDGVLEEPELGGVEQLGANGVMLRLVVKTTPSQQWRVSRELRERIKVAFDEEGIEIPFPQQTVWHTPAEVS